MRPILTSWKTIRQPSVHTVRNRIQDLSRRVSKQELELLLFTAMLLVILYSAYSLAGEPQTRWITRVETARELLREEIQALAAGEPEEQVQGFKQHAQLPVNQPGSAQGRAGAAWNPEPLHNPDTADRPGDSARATASPPPPSRP